MPSRARLAHARGVYTATGCPTCPARRGQPCLSDTGRVRVLPHQDRADAFYALIYPDAGRPFVKETT